jgi:hypothetical protein
MMEFYEGPMRPYEAHVPEVATAEWYETVWHEARNLVSPAAEDAAAVRGAGASRKIRYSFRSVF